ncbi:CD109 antigen [Electrophorus electricus]|uniref:CD109 antigen n=1 Tax=Electrophorus electricus TaxID=8005 RepID=UPI0015CFE6C8|nr:CD109 antigen [Electrophorus electricus]
MEWLHIFIVFGIFEVIRAAQNSSSSAGNPTYLVSVSRVVRPDTPTTLSVTVLTGSPVTVISEIILGNTSVAHTQSTIKGGSTKMQVLPPIPEDDWSYLYPYKLIVTGYIGDTLIFANSTVLHSSPRNMSILLQTDKPGYRPEESVKIRAVVISPNGKPCDEDIDLVIMDPRGNIVQQWLSMDTVLGTVDKEFQLSQNPPLGRWKIVATANEVTQDKPFHVDHHVVRKFEVLVEAPKVLYYKDRLTSSVTAQYYYGKPVVGNISVVYIHSLHGIKTYYEEQQMIYGTSRLSLDVPDLYRDNNSNHYTDPYHIGLETSDYIDINVQVTELLTGNAYSDIARVSIVMSRYGLEFQQYDPIIKPSLNFSAQLRLFTYNDHPLAPVDLNRTVTITVREESASPWNPRQTPRSNSSGSPNSSHPVSNFPYPSGTISVKTLNLSVPADGLIPLHVQLSKNVTMVIIEAQYEDVDETLQLHTSYSSPSNSYIQLRSTNTPQIEKPLHLIVESNFPLTVFHYVVTVRGQVVAVGTLNSSLFVLSPTVSWIPLANVLVYLIRSDGEVINAALDISFTRILRNDVSLRWEKDRAEPSQVVSLSVSVLEADSLVGILVVDKGSKDSDRSNDITEEEVMEELTKYARDEALDAMMGMGDPYSVFMVNGVTVLTDARMSGHTEPLTHEISRPGRAQIPALEAEGKEEPHCCRTSWLWLYINMSISTTESFPLTVPNSMMSWVATAFVISKNLGLGLSAPVELEVFKHFFLYLNLPPYIIRGEVLLLEVSIFNRVDWHLEVVVILDESNMFDLVTSEGAVSLAVATHRVRVWGKSHATVFFPIRATELGHMPISLRALALYTSDSVFHTILVKPEGMEQSFTQTLFMEFAPTKTTLSRDLEFHFPAAVVEGSQRAQVTVVGDILGPSISGLDSLIQMPCGCGEQNMVYFAPAVYVLQYLSRVGQLDEETLSRALGYMEQGYQRELSYQRLDGSFSAFGDIDPSGSTWLTAFVLKCFVQAQPFIFIDTAVLTKAAGWLRAQQTPTGAFQEPGRVIHTQLLDGLGGQLSLTAYVLVAVLEDPEYTNIFAGQISGAVDYLTFKLKQGISSSYSLCLVTYALTLAHSPFAGTALTELMNRAQVHDGVPMWSSPDDSLATSWQPPTADIEMAAYVLLTLYRQGIPEQGYALMKWLLQQRNYMGGFGSTQDTVIALQALSAYATLSSSEQINLAIRVTSATATVASFTVDRNNYLQYQSQEIEAKEKLHIEVSASGRGFALFQLTTFYNIEAQEMTHRLHDAYTHEAFDLYIHIIDFDLYSVSIHIIFRLKENKVVNQTSMTILEVGLLTGFGLAQEGIPLNDLVRRVETSPGKVILYLDSVKTTDASVLIPTTLEFKVTGVQEAAVVIYDYYEPRRKTVRTYMSETRHKMAFCDFCGEDCSQCDLQTQPVYNTVFSSHALRCVPQSLALLLLLSLALCF